jgi:O-antigen/teichoic acid export membrane protein
MVVPVSAALVMLADPLLHAWLGKQAETVKGAIPVLQILAIAVVVRVGGATSNTLLKGAEEHRRVAWVNIATGVVNAALSIILIKRWGLVGVAWGTLFPIVITAAFIQFPYACRKVGVPVRRAVIDSVLPAIWPAIIVGGLIGLVRDISSGTLLAVALQAAAGGMLYLALFFTVAISKHDRAYYIAKATQLTRRRRLAPAAGV